MATLYRTDDAVSFCSRKCSCHSIALGENTKKLNRDITGMLERLLQRMFIVYEEGITLEEYYRKEDQIKGWLKSDDGSGD